MINKKKYFLIKVKKMYIAWFVPLVIVPMELQRELEYTMQEPGNLTEATQSYLNFRHCEEVPWN